jgi:SAM-dependent methyltransferase
MSTLTRKIYYSLPPGMRFTARWLLFLPLDVWNSVFSIHKKLIPPRRLIFTGGGDFIQTGELFKQDLISKKLIEPNSHVLDIGSGIGRIAIPLISFLNRGRYEGFDIMKSGIQWCKKNITSRFPHFKFSQVELSNDLYKNSGGAAASFSFPYASGQFDLAIATSVFTHMLPDEVKRYVSEIFRILKPGGKAYLTFFLLNENSIRVMQEGNHEFHFKYQHGPYRLLDEKVKSANVAYDESYLLNDIISSAQFEVESISYGWWSTQQKDSPVGFQDRVVIRKK